MRNAIRTLITLALPLAWTARADSELRPGAKAPAFTLSDTAGKSHALADYAGKLVVLEAINHECPFVKKHYSTGNMQKLQKHYAEKGVIWFSLSSSAPGKPGHYTAELWQQKNKENGSNAAAVLLDTEGKVGRAYGARTTPHMFVIGKDGTLLYRGAIDNDPSADPKKVAGARNYVAAALDAALQDKAVETAETKPYGCSVKY
jgi:peroxiredoxin